MQEIRTLLETLAKDTDTRDLAVALYFGVPGLPTRGTAYIRDWHTPKTWQAVRGLWKHTAVLPQPSDLPPRYRLIRMHLAHPASHYPRKERDIYGWEFQYASLYDHLALLFAHELHHFRRYHLDLHPREGEHAANQWALERCRQTGCAVEGRRLAVKKKKSKKRPRLWDAYKTFRPLLAGDAVQIIIDPKGMYQGQQALVERPIRAQSKRIVIKTGDGKVWRWPMAWVKVNKKRKTQ